MKKDQQCVCVYVCSVGIGVYVCVREDGIPGRRELIFLASPTEVS